MDSEPLPKGRRLCSPDSGATTSGTASSTSSAASTASAAPAAPVLPSTASAAPAAPGDHDESHDDHVGGLLAPNALASALARNWQVNLQQMFHRQSAERELKEFLEHFAQPGQRFAQTVKSMLAYIWCKEYGDARDTNNEIMIGLGHQRTSTRVRSDMDRVIHDLISEGGIGELDFPSNRAEEICEMCNMPKSACGGRCEQRQARLAAAAAIAAAAVLQEDIAYINYMASTCPQLGTTGAERLESSGGSADAPDASPVEWACMNCNRLSAECGGSCFPVGPQPQLTRPLKRRRD